MGKRRSYTEEFKRDAFEHSLNSDKIVKEVAGNLGINYNNLSRWRREYRNNGNQKLTPEQQKIKELEDKLKEAKLERDILKKQWPSLRKSRSNIWFYPGPQ